MKRSLFLTIILILGVNILSVQADIIDKAARDICNRIIRQIYKDILDQKKDYPELKDFNRNVLAKNRYGMYSIQYKESLPADSKRKIAYELAVSVVKMSDVNHFWPRRGGINLGFPLIDLKIIGFQTNIGYPDQFDVTRLINTHGRLLWDYQQSFMPFRLTLNSVKSEFKAGEPIFFSVELKNYSQINLKLKKLSAKTLQFSLNNTDWDVIEATPALPGLDEEVMLRPGESMAQSFRGDPVKEAGQAGLYAAYMMDFQGIQPTDVLNIRVIE